MSYDYNLYNDKLNDNLYKILEIELYSEIAEVKKSFKKLALKYHPDKNNLNNSTKINSDKFIKIKNAYDILSDVKLKRNYDNYLKMNLNQDIFEEQNIYTLIFNFIKFTDIKIILKILSKKEISSVSSIRIENIKDYFVKNESINLIKDIIDIKITIDFTLKEIWENIPKKIKYSRETKEIFEEEIYPLDLEQIYENEGEEILYLKEKMIGNLIVKINPIETEYKNELYYIHKGELYILINKQRIQNNKFEIIYLDDCKYKFNINKLEKITNELGIIYKKRNFGLKQNILTESNNTTDIEIQYGNLFFIIII